MVGRYYKGTDERRIMSKEKGRPAPQQTAPRLVPQCSGEEHPLLSASSRLPPSPLERRWRAREQSWATRAAVRATRTGAGAPAGSRRPGRGRARSGSPAQRASAAASTWAISTSVSPFQDAVSWTGQLSRVRLLELARYSAYRGLAGSRIGVAVSDPVLVGDAL